VTALADELASYDSVPCKPSHGWSPICFFLSLQSELKMCPAIDNRASCENRAVIRLLHAIDATAAADIHLQLCMVYGRNIMSKGTVT
jgi:hypothetical protein